MIDWSHLPDIVSIDDREGARRQRPVPGLTPLTGGHPRPAVTGPFAVVRQASDAG